MTGTDVMVQLALGTILFLMGVGVIQLVAFLRGYRD